MSRDQLIDALIKDRLENASVNYLTDLLQYGFPGFESFTLAELQREYDSIGE